MQTKCPGCEKILRLPDNAGGKRIKCSSCNHAFIIPLEKEIEDAKPTQDSSPKNFQALLHCIASAKADIDRSLKDRDEAMELVDSFFQMFLERAENQEIPTTQQEEYREIAQKIFELQKRFPLLSGVRDVLLQCETALQS